jgi:hypothetical protein
MNSRYASIFSTRSWKAVLCAQNLKEMRSAVLVPQHWESLPSTFISSSESCSKFYVNISFSIVGWYPSSIMSFFSREIRRLSRTPHMNYVIIHRDWHMPSSMEFLPRNKSSFGGSWSGIGSQTQPFTLEAEAQVSRVLRLCWTHGSLREKGDAGR